MTTWTAAGTTDEITICDHCGRTELKGTVRMTAGESELFMGTSCAANMTGKPAREITREAKAGDRAAREGALAAKYADDRSEYAAQEAWFKINGLERNFQNLKAYRAAAV